MAKTNPSIGVSVNLPTHSNLVAGYIQRAMSDEILKCNAEGISTSEENSDIIRGRMLAVRDRALEELRQAEEETIKRNQAAV